MTTPVKVDKIVAMENGPILVRYSEGKVDALCRCGRSGSKPYCDGSHQKTGECPEGCGEECLCNPVFTAPEHAISN